jgi:hypothetical protein
VLYDALKDLLGKIAVDIFVVVPLIVVAPIVLPVVFYDGFD